MSDTNVATPLGDWHPDPGFSGHAADWLTQPGLVTRAVQRAAGAPLLLDVLQEGNATFGPDVLHVLPPGSTTTGWEREIIMHANGQTLVHATTSVPATTLAAEPWLATLGKRPLGYALARHPAAHRTRMLYCRSDRLPGGQVPRTGPDGWSRRSLFDLDGHALLLIEHFAATLLNWPREIDTDE
ncbi:MAG: chorismate lyase [Pseudomonadota bacterium]